MGKVDLGLVTALPWTDMYEFFDYPQSPNYKVVGGFKKYQEKCYILLSVELISETTLSFPTPTEPIEIKIERNGEVETVLFNGSIAGVAGDIIKTGGVYVYNS